MKKIVVIGASAASISFITKLRSFDTESQIICFSGESSIPYNRCLLADFVQQEKSFEDIRLKSENFFQEHNVDLRLQSWVTSIDRSQKFVVCNDKQESYDYLFIGIGTHAFVPPIQGVDLPGVFTFHTFQDVDTLDDFIYDTMPKHAIVVGAGINGVEAASALVARGLQVTIVDGYDRVMPLHVDEQMSHAIELEMKQAGVHILKGHQVTALLPRNAAHVGKIQLQSGAFVPTDCVILATGCRPNTDIVAQAGLVVDQGFLVVNEYMQTNDPFIFAGGDICKAPDIISKQLVRSATWSDAMLQGLTAATQLSSTPRLYPGVVGMRDSKFFGLEFYACGQTVEVDIFTTVVCKTKDYFHVFYLFDEKLQGFVLLDCIENLAKYRTLYLTQQQVSSTDLCSAE